MKYPNKSLEIPLETLSRWPREAAFGDAASASVAMTVGQLALPGVRRKAREPPRNHRRGAPPVALIVVGIMYFTFASLGLHLASINPSATPSASDGFGHCSHFVVGHGLRLPSLLPPF